MIGLPEAGDKVRIWPTPGRNVQLGARPTDRMGGGRWLEHGKQGMEHEGHEVVWGSFFLEQLRSGDIMLHAPAEVDLPKPTEADLQALAEADKTAVLPSQALDELKTLSK